MSSETTAGAGVESVRGVPHGSRGAVVAVGAVFAINGLAIGGWAGVLPVRTVFGAAESAPDVEQAHVVPPQVSNRRPA